MMKRKEEELRGDGVARSIVFDMERIVALTRSYHIPVMWYNYPWPMKLRKARQGRKAEAAEKLLIVLQTIYATGERLGIPVLKTESDYLRAEADGYTLEDLGDRRAGLHPSRILFGYIAESMVPLVEEALREWHGIDLSRAPESDTPTRDD